MVPVGLAASGVFRGGAPPVYMHVAGGVQACTGFERQQPEAKRGWLLAGFWGGEGRGVSVEN